eukprot:5845160-Heterocapsa_arctica.AAC.1
MTKERLGKIGQKLQTTKTVILAVAPGARKAVKEAFKFNCWEDLHVPFSARPRSGRDVGSPQKNQGPTRQSSQHWREVQKSDVTAGRSA